MQQTILINHLAKYALKHNGTYDTKTKYVKAYPKGYTYTQHMFTFTCTNYYCNTNTGKCTQAKIIVQDGLLFVTLVGRLTFHAKFQVLHLTITNDLTTLIIQDNHTNLRLQ